MLLDAKDLQYEVPESALKEALDFLEQQVVTDRHRHYRNHRHQNHYREQWWLEPKLFSSGALAS